MRSLPPFRRRTFRRAITRLLPQGLRWPRLRPPRLRPPRWTVCALPVALLLGGGLAGAQVQPAQDENLDTALLEVLLEQGVIKPEQYDKLLALARERAAQNSSDTTLIEASLQRLAAPDVQVRGGGPTKLVFRSPDGKWTLGLKGELQVRGEVVNSEDDTKDDTNFSVPRARFTMEGTSGAPNVKYKVTLDMPTQTKDTDPATDATTNVRDAYIDWGFRPGDAVRLGQFKFPFGREMLWSTSANSFPEVSIASTEFSPNYEPGSMYYGNISESLFEYFVALSNGEGRGKNNTIGSTRNGLRKGLRVVWNPMGAMKLEGPAFQTVDDDSTKLSFGADYMQNQDSTGLSTVTADAQASTAGFDVQLDSGPFSALAELYSRSSDVPGAADVSDSGGTYQVGWLFADATWELVARTSFINFGAKDDQSEHSLGLNYYLDRHNGKWQLELSQLGGEGSTPDSDRIRLQYQALF